MPIWETCDHNLSSLLPPNGPGFRAAIFFPCDFLLRHRPHHPSSETQGHLVGAGGSKSGKEMKRCMFTIKAEKLINMRRFISLPDLLPAAPTKCPLVSEDAHHRAQRHGVGMVHHGNFQDWIAITVYYNQFMWKQYVERGNFVRVIFIYMPWRIDSQKGNDSIQTLR